ncbi:DUF4347 domain-containing protein [Niabella insulamsoli]|uniref:DUF4347 domain-containing protein n=1 Tax=Niabella insulamsoli TaxID=3144874 RepID=UPI0031FD097C
MNCSNSFPNMNFRKFTSVLFLCVWMMLVSKASMAEHVYIDEALRTEANRNIVAALPAKLAPFKSDFFVWSHGRPGALLIEGQWLSGQRLLHWFQSQKNVSGMPVRIYGCAFGKGAVGREAVAMLSNGLGVAVSASDNLTGENGDWLLEVGEFFDRIKLSDFKGNLQVIGGYEPNDDFDGDGVINSADDDDDNDGILDLQEGCIQSLYYGDGRLNDTLRGNPAQQGNQLMYTFASGSLTANNNRNIRDLIMNPAAGISTISAGSGLGLTVVAGAGSATLNGVNAATLAEAKANNDYIQFTFRLDDLFATSAISWVGFLNGIQQTGFTATYSVQAGAGAFTDVATRVQATNEGGSANRVGKENIALSPQYATVADVVYTVRIYFYGLNAGITTMNIDDIFLSFDLCGMDTDGDDISNSMETDSDGDGCPDALEGSASFTYANLTAGLMLTGGVSATGVPTITGSPQEPGYSRAPALSDPQHACDPPQSYNKTESVTGAPTLMTVPALEGSDPTDQPSQGAWLGGSLAITQLPSNQFILVYDGVDITTVNQVISNYDPAKLTIAPTATTPGGTSSTSFAYATLDAQGQQDPSPATVTLNFSQPLPVIFGDIQAALDDGGSLRVRWQSLNEQNNDRYEIESSFNGIDFKVIGTVASKAVDGNADHSIEYEFSATAAAHMMVLGMVLLLGFAFTGYNKYKNVVFIMGIAAGLGWLSAGCGKENSRLPDSDNQLYIRIAQIDKDGSKQYSKVVKAIKE